MPLIISPKTTAQVIGIFNEAFQLRKIPAAQTGFWHGNFKDSFYEGLDGRVKVLFTGYSGAVVGHALLEYADHYLSSDQKPEAYFVGSVYAFRHSRLELGDLAYATDTFSPDSYEHAIYKNAKAKGIAGFKKPDPVLLQHVLESAAKLDLRLKPTKVYCRISPGHLPNFTRASQLIDEAMWFKLALDRSRRKYFDSGEYESAAFLATSRFLGLPAVALFDVKDKRISPKDYHLASDAQKVKALRELLVMIKETVLR